MRDRTTAEKRALLMLLARLSSAVGKTAALHPGPIAEIRIRARRPLTVTVNGREYATGAEASDEDVEYTVRALSGNSLYSHAETIREGYICAEGGIRAGVCGRAITRDGVIDAVTGITSINVRIPHRVHGAADAVFDLLRERRGGTGLLVWSKPGIGKTTVLRELIPLLSGGERAERCAVVDTRYELSAGLEEEPILADFLLGYPRGKGIEIAVRTLSPRYVVCDEISTDADARAVEEAASSGTFVVASCHAFSTADLASSPVMSRLFQKNVFTLTAGLLGRDENGPGYALDVGGPEAA